MNSNIKYAFMFLIAALLGLASVSYAENNETLVFDFESGDLQKEGWRIIEGANTKPIGSRDTEFHNNNVSYVKNGKYYLTSLESSADSNPTDDTICVIESPVFVISGPEAKLLLGGGKRPQTYIGLCPVGADGAVGEPVLTARGNDSQGMDEVVWDTSKYIGKVFVLQLVDKETGPWAHIRMDDFRTEGNIDTKMTAVRVKYLENVVAAQKATETARIEAAKKNPSLLENPILYVTREQYLPDHHNTETMFQTCEINTEKFRGGGSMRIWNPKDDSVEIILDVPEGIVRDPCISFDAKRVLVSIRRDIRDDYHIYELDLEKLTAEKTKKPLTVLPSSDLAGTALKQLTFLAGVSDIDPLYLPSDEIAFSASREPKYCMCNRHIMCNLYKMNSDGSNIRQIGKSTLFEGHSSLTPDGRIIYSRWEYVDRNFGDAQGVWITSSEGFNHAIFWGNNTASPGAVLDAKIVPGSSSMFISTFSSCHDRPWGAIALTDREHGIDGKAAVLQTWPASAIDLVDRGGYDTFTQVNPKFEDPFPLSAEWFLAVGTHGKGEKTGIYLLGRDGTMILVHDGGNVRGCFDPMPLKPTVPPPADSQKADLTDPNGYFAVMNVYEGFGMDSVPKNAAKYLRVVESPEKRTWSASGWENGTGEQAPGMAWKDFNNKRILGMVEIEDDGSVSFAVPADTFLYLQLLDEKGRMIQSMRSGMIARPGETNACYGCHEDRLETFPPLAHTPKSLLNPPRKLDDWNGPPRLFSYVKEVQQPVFDKYCTECHDYGKVESNPKMPNLAGDLNIIFNTSYVQLHSRGLVSAVGAGPHEKLKPYSWGSTRSRLSEVLINGHPGPKIDLERKEKGIYIDLANNPEEVGRVVTWIDLNAPYYGTYLSSFPENRYGRAPISDTKFNRLSQLTGFKGRDLDWGISFTRPELSPCLSKWKTDSEKKSAEYREAVAIIEEGKAALEKTPRGEDPDTVPAPPRVAAQERKYERMRELEIKMREAILKGERMYDPKE